jgi:hypothetical protein
MNDLDRGGAEVLAVPDGVGDPFDGERSTVGMSDLILYLLRYPPIAVLLE